MRKIIILIKAVLLEENLQVLHLDLYFVSILIFQGFP